MYFGFSCVLLIGTYRATRTCARREVQGIDAAFELAQQDVLAWCGKLQVDLSCSGGTATVLHQLETIRRSGRFRCKCQSTVLTGSLPLQMSCGIASSVASFIFVQFSSRMLTFFRFRAESDDDDTRFGRV